MDKVQQIQADQYAFPYHFLPVFNEAEVRLARQWNWAPSYLAALQLLSDWIEPRIGAAETWGHIDIGCGDGALLYHLADRFADRSNVSWTGVDYDENAIRWAEGFGGGRIDYRAIDIAEMPADTYDSATLIEVAEHIPPDDLDGFVKSIARVLKPGASLIVTVPHNSRSVQPKHYQHFSYDQLRDVFEPHFETLSIRGFGRHTRFTRLLQRAIINRKYVFTYPPLTERVLRELRRLHADETGVARIFAEFRKPG